MIQPDGELIEMLLGNFLLAAVFGYVLAQQADGVLAARALGRLAGLEAENLNGSGTIINGAKLEQIRGS